MKEQTSSSFIFTLAIFIATLTAQYNCVLWEVVVNDPTTIYPGGGMTIYVNQYSAGCASVKLSFGDGSPDTYFDTLISEIQGYACNNATWHTYTSPGTFVITATRIDTYSDDWKNGNTVTVNVLRNER
jgi:hypothetical protein